ncbi:MAG: DNA glycosylase AlkZ-like family protein, partial [Anaerolineales bacterium]
DLASWSGLKISAAREAWQLVEQHLVEVEVAGKPAWMLEQQLAWLDELLAESHPTPDISDTPVSLLPKFDTYLLGYASREMVVEAEYARRIHPGGGLIYPVLLVSGRALGTWKTRRRREHLEIIVTPFERLPDALVPLVEAEAADIRRFLGRQVVLTLDAPLQD